MKFLLLIPLFAVLELYLLIKIGVIIGAFNMVLWVILSVIIGAGIIKNQGMGTMLNLRAQMRFGQPIHAQFFDTILIFVAGIFIILPGLLTDCCGLLLLLPWVRQSLFGYLQKRAWIISESHHIFEGQYERKDQDEDKHLH